MSNLPEINYKSPVHNPTVSSDLDEYDIPYFKNGEYFGHLENFVRFVKAVEALVRKHKDYKKFKAFIMKELGIDFCQVLSNIHHEEDAPVDMHHGPILTLFDYTAIITDYLICKKDSKITTFYVADKVLQAHFDGLVQVVMLSESAHEAVHTNDLFLSTKQAAYGDLIKFIETYREGMNAQHISKINEYIRRSNEQGSYDNDVFKLYNEVCRWAK